MADLVSATYYDDQDAQKAVDALIAAGADADDITVVAPSGPDGGAATVDVTVPGEEGRSAEEIGEGMAVGGLLGLAAANAGMGVGGAGQPLATPAGAVVAGAMAGALLGAAYEGLVQLGLKEDVARLYERRLQAGDTAVVVRARRIRPEEARELLEAHGGADVRGP